MSTKSIEAYLDTITMSMFEKSKSAAQLLNDRSCAVCGHSEFVRLYRNVVGKVEGHMQGYFSLFGGAVEGHISGTTSTLPVLSCRNCTNERTIETYDYILPRDLFWSSMYDFCEGIEKYKEGDTDNYYINKFKSSVWTSYSAVEVREYMKSNPNWAYTFLDDISEFSPKTWSVAGFDIKPTKKSFLWFHWDKWPTWKELLTTREKE